MAEYIERKALMAKIAADGNPDNLPDGYNATPNDVFVFAIAAVETFPAADVEPVIHARWEICEVPNTFDTMGNPDRYARCTNCGFHWNDLYSVRNYFKGCPRCRAKMDL